MQLDEHLIANLAGKTPVRFMGFDVVEDFHVVQIGVLEDERLAHEVVGGIPQVL